MTPTFETQSNIVSSGTDPLVMRAYADLHIKLGTNADFHPALEQVMHVAELSNLSRVTPALRVAIEIQTPRGAVVGLRISRQPDSSYRAQLCTGDTKAFNWVERQMGALGATTETGTAIWWAPAQFAAPLGLTVAESSASDLEEWEKADEQDSFSYRRGPAYRRPVYADIDETESLGFFETLTALAGTA